MSDITNYYTEQAKTGISGFRGSRYQKGGGIFSWLMKLGLPVLKFLGKEAVSTGLHTATDMLEGDSFKNSAKKHLKQTGKNTVKYLADKISGSGRRCKRRKRAVIKRKPCKRRRTVKRKPAKRRCRRRKTSTAHRYSFF